MESVTVTHYKPKKVFQFSRTGDHPMYGYELAKGFYNARWYNDDERADNWTSNAGAVQLFDKQTHKPITWTNKTTHQNTGIFSCVSVPVYWEKVSDKKSFTLEYKKAQLTSFGHSERICMIDLLDSYMQDRAIDHHDIKNPSHSDNYRDREKTDAFINIEQNAKIYKYFLAGSGVVVKFWSERKPCDYDQVGNQCKDFIEKICPRESQYGYITSIPQYTKTPEAGELNKKASKLLKNAYATDHYMNSLVQGILQNIKSSTDSLGTMFEQLNVADGSSTDDQQVQPIGKLSLLNDSIE